MQRVGLTLLVFLSGTALPAIAEKPNFDIAALEQLGYSEDIAKFFSEERFLPGVHDITLEVNAAKSYMLSLKFDDDGQLCVDDHFLDELKLKKIELSKNCDTPAMLWQGADIKVFPGSFRVELLLPETAFDPLKISGDEYGGGGAILNYELYGQRFSSRYGQQQSLQATLGPGLNIRNWVVRNRSQFSTNSEKKLQVYETSAVRAFPSLKGRLEMGQFGAENSLFSGVPLTGLQIMSERHQIDGNLLIPITGMADSQASIEVRQRGRTVYRTTVPPGPFSLDNVGQVVGGIDTEVEITEADGRKKTQTVVPQKLSGNIGSQPHSQLGIGRYRSYRQSSFTPPLLVMGERQINHDEENEFVMGGLFSSRFQMVALRKAYANVSGGMIYSRGNKRQGLELDTQLRLPSSRFLNMSLTSKYRTLGAQGSDEGLENTGNISSRLRMALGASISLSHADWGVLNYNIYQSRYYQGRSYLTHGLSTSRQIGSATLSFTAQNSANDPLTVFAYLSLPLGKNRLSTRVQGGKQHETATGINLQGDIDERWNYSLGAASRGNDTQFSGRAQVTLPYSQLAGDTTYSNNDSKSFNASAFGGVAFANNTWLFSPQRIGDTFAVVDMAGASGIGLQASGSGRIATDYAGHALLASVTPYTDTSVSIDTQQFPLNLRINSTSASLRLAHGTVGLQRFRVSELKQLLLTIRNTDGETMPVGVSVYDDRGNMLGTLIGDGNLMLVNEDIGKDLQLRATNMPTCRVKYTVPEYFDPEMLYEEASAICIPV
ncbi:fimbria/pilus outer membrane usher protein [Serratia liquefaciens]|uniref:fimbria/pilus outer membrane usher protein n=1 Tax=Serratia liquefaciens TaxID=614 RepID=UPI00236250D3|nr:fimbria/pilus outer membrane usher protein [Serratia liquefaciens]